MEKSWAWKLARSGELVAIQSQLEQAIFLVQLGEYGQVRGIHSFIEIKKITSIIFLFSFMEIFYKSTKCSAIHLVRTLFEFLAQKIYGLKPKKPKTINL